ncbi:MAG TPA: hypothetical protein DHV37_05950 [Erysipelotrichaceae bacterium]|nr:hypothetical protein [Erysipelotrichaceae bacterium]
MTTTEIYYGKGYNKGKGDIVQKVGSVMDEMESMINKQNPRYSRDWNKGFDDGLRTFYVALELALREEVLKKEDQLHDELRTR